MSGEPLVLLEIDPGGRLLAYVQTLARLPPSPTWVLIGGLAVNVRLARLHRSTNDIDTLTGNQPELVEIVNVQASIARTARIIHH